MFLQTDDGLIAVDQITLIDDHPADGGPWPVHYRYGSEVRVTSADGEHIRQMLK